MTGRSDMVFSPYIREIRRMTDAEMGGQMWPERGARNPMCIVLEDGTRIFPSCDDEGNGPGVLFGETATGEAFSW